MLHSGNQAGHLFPKAIQVNLTFIKRKHPHARIKSYRDPNTVNLQDKLQMQTSTQLDCATSSRICLQSHQPRMSCIKRLEAIKTPNTHRQREKKEKKSPHTFQSHKITF
jgi:hypothetical protein